MKKIYLCVLTALLSSQFANAQLTLTKAANEPVIGDMNTRKGFDSTSALPVNMGSNQMWNFSAITANTVVSMVTYTTASSTPSASSFPSATIAEDGGSGDYSYFNASSTQYALLGSIDASGTYINFSSNPGIIATWPVTMGYNATDAFSGNVSVAGLPGTAMGTMTLTGSGTGTLMLPGGQSFTNVLQVKMTQTIDLNLAGGFVTGTITVNNYQYYHASQKFPLLQLQYQRTDVGGSITDSYEILVNNNVLTGINNATFTTPNLTIYPNPANDKVKVILDNAKAENVSIEITNQFGQTLKSVEAGNHSFINQSVDVSGLASGIYFVKTSVGNKTATKKLIIQ
jgi:hypothetical protein